MYFLLKLIKKMTAIELEAYGRAGVIAEEVISSIRTVLSYNGQQKEIQRFVLHHLIFLFFLIKRDSVCCVDMKNI